MTPPYQGIYAVVCTAFDAEGDIDEAGFRRHLRYLIDECKVHGIIPLGSTGEFAFLDENERGRVVEWTIDEVHRQLPVIAGSAACSTRETVMYAQRAQQMGADGVMVVPPYYGHLTQAELFTHYATLAKHLDIPIVVYNNPGTSGSDILPETIARLAEFEQIVAVKESSGLMQRVSAIMRYCGERCQVLCGCDTLALEMFAIGVAAWVAAPANLIGKQCVALYQKAVVEKDFHAAQAYFYKLLPVLDLFESSGQYVQLAKAGLEMQGRSIGAPRPPLLPAEAEMRAKLKTILDEI